MRRTNKIHNLVLEIYRELFKQAEPSADFDELLESASINEHGQKVIPFDDYLIDEEVMEETIVNMMKRKNCGMILKPFEKRSILYNVYLGCSPKYKQ